MSIAHYSQVLNVIAAHLGMNSWNNKIHWVAVTVSSSYFMLPPALQNEGKKKKREKWSEVKKVEENGEREGERRQKWKLYPFL